MGDGFFSKIKLLVGIEDFDENEFEEDMEDSMSERKSTESRSIHNLNYGKKENRDTRVLPMPGRAAPANQFKMIVIEPKAFDECPKLVDNLKAKKPIVINLEKIESDMARKIFDFLSGATYALNGNVQKVANNIFIFAPENVDVTAQIDSQNANHTDGAKNRWR